MPTYKDFGLVLSVFDKPKIFKKILRGRSAIGHNGILLQVRPKTRLTFSLLGYIINPEYCHWT